MATYKFNRDGELLGFLFDAKKVNNKYEYAFDDWEVMYITIHSRSGLDLALNTKTADSSEEEYLSWKKIKPIIQAFFKQDVSRSVIDEDIPWYNKLLHPISDLDIRLRCPKDIKQNLDKEAQFDSFRLSFLINSGLILVSSTYVEKSFPVLTEPIEKWEAYVADILNLWKSENGL